MTTIYDTCRSHGLVRPREGRILGGVCAGLGERFGLEPWIARLLFVLILFVIPGSQILIYPILWIVMPPVDPGPGPASPVTLDKPFPHQPS
ncbi:MAG: PspC domain-containing protein [Dactylosporangium sp.]|nr:PspC domain-containing protein [Dactylosporangium sp.]NNJ62065.1 PspC domain-containing protein [Dactylosporangium sp.]